MTKYFRLEKLDPRRNARDILSFQLVSEVIVEGFTDEIKKKSNGFVDMWIWEKSSEWEAVWIDKKNTFFKILQTTLTPNSSWTFSIKLSSKRMSKKTPKPMFTNNNQQLLMIANDNQW